MTEGEQQSEEDMLAEEQNALGRSVTHTIYFLAYLIDKIDSSEKVDIYFYRFR